MAAWRVSEQQKQADNRARATTDEFRAFVARAGPPGAAEVDRPVAGRGAAAARREVSAAPSPGSG